MSLSFLLLLFLSHLILSAWAHGEKHLAPKGQPGPAATGRNPAGASSSRSSRGTTSSSSSSVSSSPSASLGNQGSGLEQSSFQWSPSGRRTGSLYCRVGIGFHLQIYPDGKVNGSHEANMLSILEIFAVSQGIVGIRGVFSNKFLAMSKKGKLHASVCYLYGNPHRAPFWIYMRPNLQMTASSGSDSKKTVIIPMPQQYTELSQQAGNGMWPSTREGKLSEAAARGLNPSTSLPTFCQDSSSWSSQNFLSRSLFLRRKSHPVLSSQRFPFLHLGKVPTP
ncbi:fibroblast growth factor 5 isoform X1 [Neofelis nebulosa]|uniref:fibroblast growth factor 5 isoform X1 n=1 Tax=Neofelis nebulosa TaxID=61452 RepID=UPI00272B1A23|nr:fibroblast growth factor 5 isoform X1 [Neofelis nebulosa]